jgi:anti-anti-sigma factor
MLAEHQILQKHPQSTRQPELPHAADVAPLDESQAYHLQLHGALDAAVATRLRHTLRQKLAHNTPPEQLILNLASVRRIDAHGLGALLYLRDLCSRHHCHLTLQAPSPAVVKILIRTRLADGFRITPPVASHRRDATWHHRLDRWHTCLDQFLAAVGLVALFPLLTLIALAIKLDSPGPVFFRQPRMGSAKAALTDGPIEGQIFSIIKFRTMVPDAEKMLSELQARNQYADGAFFKLRDDPRISRVGRFLRRTSLDELPQLINVLKGQMRLVGNRPLPLYEAAALLEPWQRVRFLAPAGITGLWQISGRSDTDAMERLVLDTYYSATRTWLGDWWVLVKTLRVFFRQNGAR